MRVLAIHRYYWPDTPPYASLLRSIVARWVADGHDVDVLSSQPSYKAEVANERRPPVERVDGARVRRVAMHPDRSNRLRRVTNVARFPLLVALQVVLGRRHDLVMCSTAPPVVLAWLVSLAARLRGARFVYHCMDLHPEIGVLSGEFANPAVRRLLARMELSACRRAWRIIVLSEDMRQSVLHRDPGLEDRLVVLTNFEIPDHDSDPGTAQSPLAAARGPLRIVFAGNLGRFQGLEAISAAMLGDEPGLDHLQLVLMGEGAAKQAVAALVRAAPPERRERIVLLPHGSPAQARALLRTADFGLVSLTPRVARYAFPSKTATYLSEGLPLLVRVERDSGLADLVRRHEVGHWVPDDVASARSLLISLAEDREGLPAMRRRARELWREEFGATALLDRWSDLLAGPRVEAA